MEAAREKTVDLKRRIKETEQNNDVIVATIERTKRMIQRARLERAILMERLETQANHIVATELESPPDSPVFREPSENPVEKRKETKKQPALRDPSLPKRPQNAYIIFCDTERENIKRKLEEAHPDGNFDVNKVLSEKWKSLGAAGRHDYHELYKKDRLRYAREMALVPSAGLSPTVQKEKQRAATYLKKVEMDGDGEAGTKRKSPMEDDSDFMSEDGDDVTEDEDLRPKEDTPAKHIKLEPSESALEQPSKPGEPAAHPAEPAAPAAVAPVEPISEANT
ncbi:Non-histone protein 10 [Wickerhamiella sorbophila]|uniref:Non-histone protein 10 n=1 Tax=Wickerhamiella sorbophila TaxID=45607 RepID=A0A2T0FGA1_9ASCO|nr:Non-histone protein 10 [Wickerhamiella sorbophila]PRT53979.1 Non-histone protein 10 [Wickerhamiella sorbophila]